MLRLRFRQTRLMMLKSGMYFLFFISIPWYRRPGQFSSSYEGFPDWVLTALLCYALITGINVALWFVESPPE